MEEGGGVHVSDRVSSRRRIYGCLQRSLGPLLINAVQCHLDRHPIYIIYLPYIFLLFNLHMTTSSRYIHLF
jgi:hypothetical protein